ncbi:helix-turn-helix domain-containing protein [Cronobacter turicensis]|uniref:helix-turn-helix domain-containing protein n=1 Tax=Cronobacter turicensis TaxID=413502 RepID=UPI001375F3C4|nr:helix-turn-helix domain-containing protein [Cronobacter turicensis]MEB8537625.1 helix-turn-helix domain-containing protein [Cronobacter sakazakii]EKM0525173.1 helix-turn-helix domain-containing protein [Cronobacter turicensis]EKY3198677.1 helix-turn-helix domain-containing protein [Cronobacter turicensis]EKY3210431.1 helix-turn-helix domain-containing protein [Cronobacter turicensis]EKY3214113.1 helix-turn-helix domain-containing protein [Cronobacter turicensis]
MNHYPLPQRPDAQINALINALQGHGTIKEYPRGSCLTQNEESVNILLSGSLAMTRDWDNLIFFEIHRPNIIGISLEPHNPRFERFRLIIKEDSLVKKISRADFFKVIEEQKLWQETSHVISFYYHVLLWKSYHFYAADSYVLVRKSLITLGEMTPETRMNINASQYITSTTNLSKSYVMKVIQELRKGGYIEIQRGRLISLGKLPQKY